MESVLYPVINPKLRNPIPEIAFASEAEIYPDQIAQHSELLYPDIERVINQIRDAKKRHDTILAEAETKFRQPRATYAGQPRYDHMDSKQEVVERTFRMYGQNPKQKKGHTFKVSDKLSKVAFKLRDSITINSPSVQLRMIPDNWLESNHSLLTAIERSELDKAKVQRGYRQIILAEMLFSGNSNDMNMKLAGAINTLPELIIKEIIQGEHPYLDMQVLDLKPAKTLKGKS